ncbi:TPA: hypothetical protein DEW05_01860 [Candidatus Saccharibacteria bacterium]|nr:hypothetical protein [Candidatus Saccharibacteria bacterium]
MGMYIRQDEQRSKLQEKIAADLRAKSAAKANGAGGDFEAPKLDGAEDAGIVENTHTSSPILLATWLIVGAAAVGTIIFLVIQSS